MKSWNVPQAIREDSRLAGIVDQIRPVLDDVLGTSAGLVDATWEVGEGGRGVVLRLADGTWPQGVSAEFAPHELGAGDDARRRLRWLWGDLLQARNHVQLRNLQSAVE